jgi:hypothetical protein
VAEEEEEEEAAEEQARAMAEEGAGRGTQRSHRT